MQTSRALRSHEIHKRWQRTDLFPIDLYADGAPPLKHSRNWLLLKYKSKYSLLVVLFPGFRWLCTKSSSVSPWSGRVIIAQPRCVGAGTTGEDILVREADG